MTTRAVCTISRMLCNHGVTRADDKILIEGGRRAKFSYVASQILSHILLVCRPALWHIGFRTVLLSYLISRKRRIWHMIADPVLARRPMKDLTIELPDDVPCVYRNLD